MNTPDRIVLHPLARPVDRTIRPPGSKSLSNRALLVAALARGESHISGLLLADDTRLMVDALRALGIPIRVDEDRRAACVQGHGGYWPSAEADLFCGNAGTVIRFLTAACCLGHGAFRLDGVPRMRQRPISELVNALHDLGAMIGYEDREGYCPLTVQARGLRGGQVRFDSPASSQYVSAVLMAAPAAADDVLIERTGELPSEPYVDMTLRVMESFGIGVVASDARRFIVPGRQTYSATDYSVEPDASAATYFLAAAALSGGRVTIEGLGRGSLQGDARFAEVLSQMGCRVEQDDQSTTVWGPLDGRLRGVAVELNAMPDTTQTLAVLAAFADGPTVIRNVANLRIKETDRLTATATELRRMGVAVETRDDWLTITPDPSRPPRATEIETYGDHRMAMSFAVAGLRVEGLTILGPACVAKTYPTFFDDWSALAGRAEPRR